MKLTPKEQQLRAMREAKAARLAAMDKDLMLVRSVTNDPVTENAIVTRPGPIVTRRGGRSKVHATNADKQRAYRARRKGNA